MDCRTCQPTLLDLAYGELAPELAQVVRAHVNGCESCGAAFKALQQGIDGSQQLTWLEAPPAMSANIMAYAEQHARERAHAAVAAKAAAKPHGGFVQSVFDFIGRMASGRQFAMATVFALVVTVGVWVIPELQPLPAGQGVTVVSPDPEGEAAPSGGLAPAEPLDLAVDARSRRIRSREELEAAAQLARNNALQAAEQAGIESEMQAPAPAAAAMAAQDELERKGELSEEYEYALKENARPSSKRRAASAGEAFPESDIGELAAAPATELRDRGASKQAPASAPAERSVDDLLDGALSSAPSAKGKTASSEGAPAQADKNFSSLERARTARSTQGCAAALPAYEQAVQEYSRSSPQSSVLGSALLELAECQWQLGRETAARATLKRASGVAPVAVRARALLERDAQPAPAKPAAPAVTADGPSKD
jgi:hypothetical protein